MLKKRRLVLCLAAAMTIISAIPVSAANTSDHYFYFLLGSNAYTSGGTASSRIEPVYVRSKTDTTSVYVYLTQTPSTWTWVRAYGNRGTAATCKYNETIGSQAKVQKGVKSSVRSNVYENATNKNNVKCQIKLKAGSGSNAVNGYWSPDSTRQYTVVN